MRRHLGIAMVTVCAVWWGSGTGAPASAEELDAGKTLSDSARLLNQQQEAEAKLAAIRAQQQELEAERLRIQGQAAQYNDQRQNNETTCGGSNYYSRRAQCEQDKINLSTSGAELTQRQANFSKQLQSVTTEGEQLKVTKEQLDRQAEDMALQLKRIEFSGTTQECVSRLPKDDLASIVAVYQQCWDGTSTAEPRLKPEKKEPSGPKPEETYSKERKRRRSQLPE